MKFIEDDYREDNPLRRSFFSPTSLSDEDKIRAIVSSWLDYLRLEELTNAKVDAEKYGTPCVWDKGVSLIGNHLILDKILFQTLKQEFKSYQKKGKSEDYQLAIAFPQICQFENNFRKFRPLFTIDLCPIVSGNYRSQGWDLTQFHQEQDKFYQRQRTIDEQQLAQYQVEIDKLGVAIVAQTSEQPPSLSEVTEDYSQFPTKAMERIAQQLELAWRKLSQRNRPPRRWYQRIFNGLLAVWRFCTGQTERGIISRLNQTIAPDVAVTKNTPFPLELILNRNHFVSSRTHVLEQLTAASQWKERLLEHRKTSHQLETLQKQLAVVQQQQQEIQERLATYPTQEFERRFFRDYHSLQVQLFKLSWAFLQQEALRKKDEIIPSIKTYLDVLNDTWDTKRQFRREGHKVYRDISLLFPVFLSTLHSLRRLFPYLHHHCIDQAIIDEAGQIPPHLPFPLLVRSRRAIFLGDPWQLEPIVSLSDEEKEVYRERAFLSRDLTDCDFDRYSPTACTAYHRAAGGSAKEGDLGNGITLKQHYRSVPEIASFCARLCYSDMIIQTSPKPSLLGYGSSISRGTKICHYSLYPSM